jgi:hypothetical protein|tara:strand:+ start:3896 stop:4360 length:465 start_codon:yes stop_codon:yes gene_type:complete
MAKRSFDAAADVEEQVGATNQEIADRDAEIKEQEAQELLRVNDLDRMRDAEDFDRVEAQTQLALSHNGWLTNSGSAALIQIANADEFEEQQIMNDYAMRVGKDKQIEGAVQDRMRGELESMTGQARGAALRAQGRQALLGGAMKAGSIGMSVKT